MLDHLSAPALFRCALAVAPVRRVAVGAWLASAVCAAALAPQAWAQPAPALATSGANPLAVTTPLQQTQDLVDLSEHWVQDSLAKAPQHQTLPLRMEVVLGRLDPRLNLAPCQQVEPYLPSGSKLWGRTRIGLRCVQGPRAWNVFLPVTVKAWGPGWVLTGNINSGDTLKPENALQSEVDWAESPHAIIGVTDDWVGHSAARNLTAGMALRQTMVRPALEFKSGAPVKVLVQGGGFSVTGAGVAIEGAAVGQTVRVRMDNGRTVVGTVNEAGDVVVTQQ